MKKYYKIVQFKFTNTVDLIYFIEHDLETKTITTVMIRVIEFYKCEVSIATNEAREDTINQIFKHSGFQESTRSEFITTKLITELTEIHINNALKSKQDKSNEEILQTSKQG